MKKLFLTLTLVIGLVVAFAGTNALDLSQQSLTSGTSLVDNPITVDGFTFTFSKGSGQTNPAYYAGIRLYANNTMTITAPEGENITSFTFTSDGNTYNFDEGENGGGTIALSGNVNTWTATTPANSITLKAKSAGQVRFTSISIETDGEGGGTGGGTTDPGTDPDPDPEPGDDDATEVTQEFTTNIGFANAWDANTLKTEAEYTATNTGITYTGMGIYCNSGYLMIRGKDAKGAFISWSLDYPIKQLVMKTSSGTSTNANSKVNVYANGNLLENIAVNATNTNYTIEIPDAYQAAGTVYKVESATTSYNQQFASFTYVKAPETGKVPAGLAFSESTATATLGQPFTAPTLTNTNNLDVTYTSSRPNVAIVDTNGNVEVLGLGVTTITAESAETDDYNAGLATYTLTVVPEDITVLSVQQAIDAIDNGSTANVKVKGFITSITEISVDYGNATYLIADTEDGEPALTVYRGKWIGGEKFTSVDQLEVGATVTVKGDLTLYGTTYELATNNEVVEYSAPVVPEPVYNQMGSYSMFVQPTTLTAEKTAEVATMTYDVYVNEADETDCYMQETGETNFLNGQKVNFNYNASAKTATVTAYYAGMLDNQNTWLAAFVYNPAPMTEPQGTYAFTFDKATGFAPAADEDAGLGWFITENATDFSPMNLYNGFYIVNEPVVEPEPEPVDVTFNFNSLDNLKTYLPSLPDPSTANGWTAETAENLSYPAPTSGMSYEGIELTFTEGNVIYKYGEKYDLRIKGATGYQMTVTAPQGYKITGLSLVSSNTASNAKKFIATPGSLAQSSSNTKQMVWTAPEGTVTAIQIGAGMASNRIETLTVTIEPLSGDEQPVEPDPVNTTPIYLMGSGNGLSWDAFPGMEVKPGEDGTYNFTIENLSSFKMSTKKAAGWDGDFNDEAFGYSGAFGDAVFNTAGMTVDLVAWGENQDMPYPGSYTIKINADRTSMNVKANFTKPVAAPDVYIRGAMNGWGGNPGDAWKFENTAWDGNSGTWTWTGTINANQEFKIADPNWGNINYSTNGTITTFNQPLTLTYNQQNSKFAETFVGTITLTVTNYTGHQATATFATEGEASFPETMYVFGNVNGKGISPDNGVAMTVTDQDNGIYTIENVLVGNEMDSGYGYIGFAEKLSASSSDWSTLNAYRFGPATADEPIEATGDYTVTFTDYNSFKVPADTYMTMTLDVKNMKLTVTAMTKDDQPTVEPNPAIEGEWTFTQDWHYAGDYSLGVQDNTYTATLEGNVVTFADEYDEYPMQAVFTAENTITFKVAAVGTPATYTLTQFPFTDGTKVTDAGMDPENFVWGDVTATFDPEAGTLTFPEGTGLCYGFANAEGVVSYYSDAFDFVTAKKAGGDQPGEELSGTGNMTYQTDMNMGMTDEPELTEPETEEVEVSYADGKLAFATFGPGSGAITFDVDVTTGGATATDVVSYTDEDFTYYYADIESRTTVVYATLYNIEGADFTTMEVKPWGEYLTDYDFFNGAFYNTVIELPFLIEGLPTQTPEEPDGWTKVTQELDGVSTDYYYQFEYQIMENFFGEGTLTLWGNYKWKDDKAPVGTAADNSAYIFVTGTGINGVLALDGNHTATTNAEDHKYVEGEECTFNFHCPFAGTELVETVNYTVRGSSSVDAIGAEEGEVIYFNLQGVRVENPTTGVYIRVANGKATKVAIR